MTRGVWQTPGVTSSLRVGVSGHRLLADPARVADDVDAALDRLAASRPARQLVAVSNLAEGADRIVARRVLARPGGHLEAILPLEADDYARDFADETSRQEFNDLLVAADQVTVIPVDPTDPGREGSYARAGHAVVAASDVLLALWDGGGARGRGGTAEVVADARAMGVPVEVVAVERRAVAP